jgi:acetyltransferase-like isoleucine patch superfamily enzyme
MVVDLPYSLTTIRPFPTSLSALCFSSSAKVHRGTVVGRGASVGPGCVVAGTVIGRNCRIGKNVVLKNCYLWDDVEVDDGCVIQQSILCSGVHVLANSKIAEGCLLGFNVVVGPEANLPTECRLTRVPAELIRTSQVGVVLSRRCVFLCILCRLFLVYVCACVCVCVFCLFVCFFIHTRTLTTPIHTLTLTPIHTSFTPTSFTHVGGTGR